MFVDSTSFEMGIMGSAYLYNIFWTNGYCRIPQSINKLKKLINWVSNPPSGRKFLFCADVIARKNTMGMV